MTGNATQHNHHVNGTLILAVSVALLAARIMKICSTKYNIWHAVQKIVIVIRSPATMAHNEDLYKAKEM